MFKTVLQAVMSVMSAVKTVRIFNLQRKRICQSDTKIHSNTNCQIVAERVLKRHSQLVFIITVVDIVQFWCILHIQHIIIVLMCRDDDKYAIHIENEHAQYFMLGQTMLVLYYTRTQQLINISIILTEVN